MFNFALIGVGGYIAVRHLAAIKETGNNLLASVDVNDSVGVIDQYFPNAEFFLEIERFERFIEKNRRHEPKNKIDFISICSPNHLHDAHIRLALRNNANAICEKPIVLNPWNLDLLKELESEGEKRVYTILQLRHHPKLVKFHEQALKNKGKQKKNITLTYITGRGKWYDFSWKGDFHKSGGIATNIGIHFFDLMTWLYGKQQTSEVHISQANKMSGFLELEDAYVSWFLSIDMNDIPDNMKGKKRTFRSILIDDNELEFSEGFTDLHTVVYQNILEGHGFGLEDARPSIQIVHQLRNQKVTDCKFIMHPLAKKILNIK